MTRRLTPDASCFDYRPPAILFFVLALLACLAIQPTRQAAASRGASPTASPSPSPVRRNSRTPSPTPTPAQPKSIRVNPNAIVRPTPTPTPVRPVRSFPNVIAQPTPTPTPKSNQSQPQIRPSQTDRNPDQVVLPKTLVFLAANGSSGSSVILKNVQYSNPKGSAGKGDLFIVFSGVRLPTSANAMFENVSAEPDGTVTAGSVALGSDVLAPDLFQSGVDLILEKQVKAPDQANSVSGKINLTRPGIAVNFSGGIKMRLPYFTASGVQAEIELVGFSRFVTTPASLLLKADGALSVSAQHVQFIKPSNSEGGLKINGMIIDPIEPAVTFDRPGINGQPFDFRIRGQAGISTFIPNLLTQEDAPLNLTSDNLVLSEEGIVSFDAKGPNFIGGFNFAQPLDFAMSVRNAVASFSDDHFTKFSMDGDLILPSSVSGSTTPIHPERAWLKGVKMNLNSSQNWDVTPGTQATTISFPTNTQDPYKLTIQSYTLDLSANGKVMVTSGQVSGGLFSSPSNCSAASSANVDNMFIDTFGVSGTALMPSNFCVSPTVGDFTVTAAADPNSKLEFKQNARVGISNLPGQVDLTVQGMKLGTLYVRVYLPDNAAPVITVDQDKPLSMLSLDKYKVGIAVAGVALQTVDATNYSLSFSGALTFNTGSFGIPSAIAADVALPFSDVNLDATKLFFTSTSPDAVISLANPANLNVGLFNVNVSQFSLPGPSSDSIKLTGGVQLASDLPLSGDLNFDGLSIKPDGTLNFGAISFNDLTLMDVATISGSLKKDGDVLSGTITSFKLKFMSGDLASSAAPGGSLTFRVGNGTWLVLGFVQLPKGIPLGSSGFALYGFRGGLGHNVALKPNYSIDPHFNPNAGTLNPDYFQTQNGNWFFQAGVRFGTDDAYLIWGDAALNVNTQPLKISLIVAANLLEQMSDSPSGDRIANGSMEYNAFDDSFQTQLDVDLAFPTRNPPPPLPPLVRAQGSADLLISKSDQHVWIGWPPNAPVAVNILGVGLSGGAAIGPGPGFGATFTWGVDFYVVSGEIDGTLFGDVHEGVLRGVLHASGEVDFYVFSASAEAMLGATMKPPNLTLTGEFDGCISVWPAGHLCASVGLGDGVTIPP